MYINVVFVLYQREIIFVSQSLIIHLFEPEVITATWTSAVTGKHSGLAKRFHGARQSRTPPCRVEEELFVLSLGNGLSNLARTAPVTAEVLVAIRPPITKMVSRLSCSFS